MNITGILQSAVFIALFLIFINGNIGWLLAYTLIAAILISFLLWLFSRKKFRVEMEDFSGVVQVGEECTALLRLSKTGFCFLPLILVEGEAAGERFEARASLLFGSDSTVKVRFRPRHCGLNKVTVSRVVAEDFFGLFRGKSKSDRESAIAVLPRRVEYIGPEVQPSLLPAESEEIEDGIAVSFGGTAGYEHRDYAAGDSPRRINYKLSAKKRKLLVRMDESSGTESTNIILTADADSTCAEQALALADKLVLGGSPVTVYHHGESFKAALPASLDKLREWLAFRDFTEEYSGVDASPSGNISVIISPTGIIMR